MSQVLINQESFLDYMNKCTKSIPIEIFSADGDYQLEKLVLSINHAKYSTKELAKKSKELKQKENDKHEMFDFSKINFENIYVINYKPNRYLICIINHNNHYYSMQIMPYFDKSFTINSLYFSTLENMYELNKENSLYLNPTIELSHIEKAQTYFKTLEEKNKLQISINYQPNNTINTTKLKI
jgi:hypothetical protein